jgi:hypothetical protein
MREKISFTPLFRSSWPHKLWMMAILVVMTFAVTVQARDYKISGKITDKTYLEFKQALQDPQKKKITRVILNSPGGAFFPAMATGKLIQAYQLDVEVEKICGSSCANYLFTAGRNKYLNRRSLLIYHGGLLQENILKQLQMVATDRPNKVGEKDYEAVAYRKKIHPVIARDVGIEDLFKQRNPENIYRDLVMLETKYFERLNIDPMITVFGQRGNYYATYNSKKYKGFYYDIASMEAMGIKNIYVKGKKWRPWKGDKNNEFYGVSLKIY